MQQADIAETATSLNLFHKINLSNRTIHSLLMALTVVAALYLTELYSFLLFHVLVEIFSVIVAFAIFMFAWNTRANFRNSALMVLGAAYLTIGSLDLLHTLSYKGMGVFKGYSADTATQLWVAARFVESLSLLAAPLFAGRSVRFVRLIAVYALIFALMVAAIFIWPIFPTCYVDGTGLTPFKKLSEYVICAILLGGFSLLLEKKHQFDADVFRLLSLSIFFTIASELMFTFYISVYGISNLVGHFLKLGSFWLIYKAIIQTGLQQPFKLLFRELKESEQQLRKSEKRFKDLVDTLPTGICEIDPQMHITYINPAGMNMIGYDRDDIEAGITIDRIIDAGDLTKVENRRAQLLRDSPIESTEYTILRKDGSKVEVVVNSRPAYNSDGLRVAQTSLTDITAFKRLQSRLQQARKMEAVGNLAGGMAHEVNNALMAVVGNIELMKLRSGHDPAPDSDFKDLLAGCDRIARLINQLLAYSRGGRYRAESIDLAQFVTRTATELQKQFKADIQVRCNADPGLPKITADSMQLKMVVAGVVNNAAEAIDQAGRIEIDISVCEIDADQAQQHTGMKPGQYVLLSINDNGKGMDDTVLLHIFEPFYSNKFPGRGLGMAAVYGIVKNHDGWIGIDSRPGVGTTVRIYFPVPLPSSDSKAMP